MEFYEWLKIGMEKEWVSDLHCETHEGPQMTDEEMEDWDKGIDPCIFIIRVWE
jgi:hypothetical protein